MRAKQARSLASETLRRPHVEKIHKLSMADGKDENHDEIDPLEKLLGDPSDDSNLANVLQSLNDNMANLAHSMSHMSESIAEIRKTSTATAKRDSRAVESEPLSSNKRMRQSSDHEGSDVEALIDDASAEEIHKKADQESDSAKPTDGNEDELLSALASEYSAEDKTSRPVSSQLADIVNKRWSSKLSDDKFKEKIAKYDRPENCDQLLAPKVNPEIWSRISNTDQRQDLKLVAIQKTLVAVGTVLTKSAQLLMDARQSDGIRDSNITAKMNDILTLQVDAIALLGHTNYELSLRRRETMKPSLNKDYASLCSSQTSVTSLLFGDELQSQLNAIRASNRISQTATQPATGRSGSHNKTTFNRRSRNDRGMPFLSKSPNPRWSNNRFTSHQKKREGGNKK